MGMIVTLVGDPNDGTHGLFVDGKLVCDSADEDATLNSFGLDFWRDAVDALCTALGATFNEESRYRPGRSDGFGEYESFWPETLEGMGPIEVLFTDEEKEEMAGHIETSEIF